jgi:hypothetical protein
MLNLKVQYHLLAWAHGPGEFAEFHQIRIVLIPSARGTIAQRAKLVKLWMDSLKSFHIEAAELD